MILNNNIVVSKSAAVVQETITINLDDAKLSKLNYILNNLNIKHLPGYWTLQELLEKENIVQNGLTYSQAFIESCVPVLEHIKRQVSRFYIFNLIERKVLNNKETELSKLLSDFVDITSNKTITKNNVLTEEIISKLLITNVNSIFNKYSNHELEDYYEVILIPSFDDTGKNKDYFNGAIDYVSNYKIDQVSVTVEPKQVNKKTHKI